MSRRASRWVLWVAVLGVLAAWVLIPHPLEGPVLFSITDDHGVHLGDLLGVAAAVAVLAAARSRSAKTPCA